MMIAKLNFNQAMFGLFYIKTHLSAIIEDVMRGNIVTVTNRNKPVAQIVPLNHNSGGLSAVERLQKIRSGISGSFCVNEYKNEGRKY